MVPGLKGLPYADRLRALGLWSLEERRNRAELLEVFKMKQKTIGSSIRPVFQVKQYRKDPWSSHENNQARMQTGHTEVLLLGEGHGALELVG